MLPADAAHASDETGRHLGLPNAHKDQLLRLFVAIIVVRRLDHVALSKGIPPIIDAPRPSLASHHEFYLPARPGDQQVVVIK
jgi:hypothetical protein